MNLLLFYNNSDGEFEINNLNDQPEDLRARFLIYWLQGTHLYNWSLKLENGVLISGNRS